MQRLAYLPEPGFVYDLLYRFRIHYEYVREPGKILDSHRTEIQSFFAAPPDDLRIFFDENSAGVSLLATHYFERFSNLFSTGKYTYAFFREQLSSLTELTKNLTAHFFPRLSQRERDAATSELRKITRLVSESDYPAELQNRLLCFYIDPGRYQRTLLTELDIQAARLRAYYEQNNLLVQHVRDALNLDALNEQFQRIPSLKNCLTGVERAAFSCTVVARQIVDYHQGETFPFLLLGLNCQSSMEAMAQDADGPDLYLFGKILSEPKRLKLIDTLLDGRAMRKDDICTLLGLSMTATHYHIDMMSRAWMLCCENRGRTFYYTLNRTYFDEVIAKLRKYGAGAFLKQENSEGK